jgi:hypothetical protein
MHARARRCVTLMVLTLCSAAMAGCVVLHRSSVGERLAHEGTSYPVDVAADQNSVNVRAVANLTAGVARNTGAAGGDTAAGIIELVGFLTSWSPETGYATDTDTWADTIPSMLKEQCGGGVVTGIQLLRETADYALVGGEVVRVRAICHRRN